MSKPVLMPKPVRALDHTLSLADIHAAMARIRDSIYLSPCARSEDFSQHTGNSVYLKLDNLQRTGAFKERGALNKLLTLRSEIVASLLRPQETTLKASPITRDGTAFAPKL